MPNKPQGHRAIVRAKCFPLGPSNEKDSEVVVTEMTTDLPSDNLGELLADAIQAGWRKGYDPALGAFTVVVTFGTVEE